MLEALSAVDTLIDMKANPQRYHSYELEEQHQEASLKDLRWWMQKAIDAMRSEAEERLHDDGPADEDTMFKRPLVESDFTVTGNSEGDEEMPADYWHGEMRAEAEAERRADAAYELAAELASCDWEGWN